MTLTIKQQLFVDEYLKCRNATEAARLAGYQGDDNVLAVTGHDNLRNPKISEAIKRRLAESAMSADEVLERLAAQARGDMSDFLKFEKEIKTPFLDLKSAMDKGLLKLVKKFKYNAQGFPEIELYDAQAALAHIGKAHGLFVDKTEVSGPGGESVFQGIDQALKRVWGNANQGD